MNCKKYCWSSGETSFPYNFLRRRSKKSFISLSLSLCVRNRTFLTKSILTTNKLNNNCRNCNSKLNRKASTNWRVCSSLVCIFHQKTWLNFIINCFFISFIWVLTNAIICTILRSFNCINSQHPARRQKSFIKLNFVVVVRYDNFIMFVDSDEKSFNTKFNSSFNDIKKTFPSLSGINLFSKSWEKVIGKYVSLAS